MSRGKLPPRRQRFVEEYALDLCATQAAIRAGYSEKTADRIGSRLLRNVGVATFIENATQKRSERTNITSDLVLRELALIAFADIGDVLDADGNPLPIKAMPVHIRRSIAAIEVVQISGTKKGTVTRVRLNDKLRALELLGRHLGLFCVKVEVSGNVSFATMLAEARERVRRGQNSEG
jgi:phage terminase small subunit